MSIVAECPHCETRFNLQADLVGKAMRCPNVNCREPFIVEDVSARPPKPPAPPPTGGTTVVARGYATGDVDDFVPFVEAEVVEAEVVDAQIVSPPPKPAKPPKPVKPAKPPKAAPPPAPPEVVEAVVVAPPPAREVVWTPDTDLPPPPVNGEPPPRRKPPRAETTAPDDDAPVLRRRKKKSNRGPVVLIGMIVLLFVIAGSVGLYLWQHQTKTEALQAEEAEKLYKDGEFGKAAKAFDKLLADSPTGPDADKYRFFAELSSTRAAVGALTAREEPRAGLDKLKAFVGTHKDSRHAKPEAYGHDVLDAGKKVVEDVAAFAADRLKAFQADTPRTKPDELKRADEMLAAGREFVPLLAPFRTKDDIPLDELGKKFAEVQAGIDRERERLATVAEARDVLKVPTDQAIEDAKAIFLAKALADDAEARALVRDAEAEFLRRVKFERDPAAPQPLAAPAAGSLLFVAPVGVTKPPVREGVAEPSAVFLAVARGVLYALDEDTGDLLWAARVGPDVLDPPAVARVDLPEGPTDLAVVTSTVAGQAAVSGYVLRTGVPKWAQPLPAPAAGAAVVVGPRAFVPVRDAAGTVFVFDLPTGQRVGKIPLGQPVGPGAAARAGTPQVYVAADARRVFVLDADPAADPRCVRVIPTLHPAGTLFHTPPVVLGPAGDDPAPRWLVLAQTDGANGMKLRVFPLPPTPILGSDAPPLVEPIAPKAETPLPGWAWFPPTTDGEQLAVVTDKSQFRLFGINQPGNQDAALFPLPAPALASPPENETVRGLVVPAEEGAFWVLVNGSLQKYRLTLLPATGQTVVPVGAALAVGVPTQPAQLNPRHDTACFVVRSANSSGCRAVAVRLQDGEPRWQRQLGVVSTATPVRTEAGVLLVDEDGGAVAIPAGAAVSGAATKAAPEWAVAAPPDGVSGPTRVAVSADGKTAFTVTPTVEFGVAKWVFRRFAGGKVDALGTAPAPAALAGAPVVMNGQLLLPAADGFVHRLVPGDGRLRPATLQSGPKWLLARPPADGSAPVCFLAPADGDTLLASDGGRAVKKWQWPAAGGSVDGNVQWALRERVAAVRVLPAAGGKPARLAVADATGGVWLYGLDRGDAPLRKWVPGRTASLPGGKVGALATQTDAAGRVLVAYAPDGKQVVCLDADADAPRWVTAAPADDAGAAVVGSPTPMGDGRWLTTDLSGRVSVLDADTGRPAVTRELKLPGAVPAAAGVPLGDAGRVVVPLSDGSAAVVELAADAKKE